MTSAEEIDLRARAGRSIRDIGHAFVGHHVPIEQLTELADSLDGLATNVAAGEPRARDLAGFDRQWAKEAPEGEPLKGYDDRPIAGRASPWGLDLEVHRHHDEIDARVTLRAAHEAAPGRCHGGIVAALFDDVFGFVLGVIEQPAFTGELTIRYEQGTPLHRPLACRARATGAEGRKIWMTGELVALDSEAAGRPAVLARGRATFITVDRQRFARSSAELPAPPDEDT